MHSGRTQIGTGQASALPRSPPGAPSGCHKFSGDLKPARDSDGEVVTLRLRKILPLPTFHGFPGLRPAPVSVPFLQWRSGAVGVALRRGGACELSVRSRKAVALALRGADRQLSARTRVGVGEGAGGWRALFAAAVCVTEATGSLRGDTAIWILP